MNEVLLCYNQVSLRFSPSVCDTLKNIDFSVNRGEFVTILGQSGSGKTTLVKLANRLFSPTNGVILFESQDVAQMDVQTLRMRMGYVIQQVGLFPHMTIEENISIVLKIHKVAGKEIARKVHELLELTQLPATDEFKRRHPWQISGGQQQRVGLARALCPDPEVLLMDEPFGALDTVTRKQLQSELKQIQQNSNKTILFVTHDLQEAISLGDRVLVLNNGKIQQYDTPKNLIFNPANSYLRKLCDADTFSQKLRFFKVKDFAEYIIRGELTIELQVDWEDSMEFVLDRMLDGAQKVAVTRNGHPLGMFDCGRLKNLQTR